MYVVWVFVCWGGFLFGGGFFGWLGGFFVLIFFFYPSSLYDGTSEESSPSTDLMEFRCAFQWHVSLVTFPSFRSQ